MPVIRGLFAALTLVVGFATSAQAQRVLIPVAFFGEMPGAYGSRWIVRLTAYNDHSLRNRIASGQCTLGVSCKEYAEPYSTFEFPFQFPPWEPFGIWVDVAFPDRVTFYYRTRDLSRQAETAGTMLPILHENDGTHQKLQFVAVPVEDRFRIMLRLYALDGSDSVKLTVRSSDTGAELWAGLVPVPATSYPLQYVPAQTQLADVQNLLGGYRGEVRVEVEASPGKRVWGFVTVTHNETQHVTVVEAQ